MEVDEGSKWLVPLLKDMAPEERTAIFVRIQSLEGVWEPLRKRNLVAHLESAFPGIEGGVADETGAEKTYSILGDWDSAPELGILSHQTPLAKALVGRKAGDTAEIPAGEDAVRVVTVKSVGPLSAEVLAWTKG